VKSRGRVGDAHSALVMLCDRVWDSENDGGSARFGASQDKLSAM